MCYQRAIMAFMGRLLKNPRQERFVKLYLQEMAQGGTAAAAYRQVYKGAKRFNCANAGACNLLRKPHVKSRIQEMRMDIKRKADITFEKILTDYQEAMDLARAKEDPGNMISAANAQAKLVGLLIDRKEVGSAGDFENMENISEILQAVSDQAGPEAALALSQAFNLIGPTVVVATTKAADSNQESTALLEAETPTDAVN